MCRPLQCSGCLRCASVPCSPITCMLQLFRKAGEIHRLIMGLDKMKRTPCGFCFVEYYTREDAEAAVKYIGGMKLDDKQIRVDIDWGFEEGRQYGRGRHGGQVGVTRAHA